MDDGSHVILFEDPMNHLNFDGMPYMWSRLWDWDVALDTVGSHGIYLTGTHTYDDEGQTEYRPEALRGEEGWTDYHVLADVRLDTDNAEANVYFRHRPRGGGFDYYTCVLSYNAQNGQGELSLRKRVYWIPYESLLDTATKQYFDRMSWHLVEVNVRNTAQGAEIQCYLDNAGGAPDISYVDDGSNGTTIIDNGRMGLAVGEKVGSVQEDEIVSFDNVLVLEE
jgi:hypothetical protein